MTENEWTTIKVLMTMEHQKIHKRFGVTLEGLNYAYNQWIGAVERHIHIGADKADTGYQINEVVSGFAELIENNPLTDEDLETLMTMFKSLKGTA